MIDLFLDDARRCPPGFTLAKNASECIMLLDECEVRVLSLDYDLGWNMPDGMEVVRHIVTRRRYPLFIYLHTSSTEGRIKMYQALYANKPEHVKLYNHPMPDDVLREIEGGKFRVENGRITELQ